MFVTELASADPTVILNVLGMLEQLIVDGDTAIEGFERNSEEARADRETKTIAHDELLEAIENLTLTINQKNIEVGEKEEAKRLKVLAAAAAGEAKRIAVEHHEAMKTVEDANVPGLENEKTSIENIIVLLQELTPTGCLSNKKLAVGGTGIQMAEEGWTVDVGSADTTHTEVKAACAPNWLWFGWSSSTSVGTLSATLLGTGTATINFGNCWNQGIVRFYKNDQKLASAPVGRKSVTFQFDYTNGDVIKLKDEGANSVISLNSLSFACRNS